MNTGMLQPGQKLTAEGLGATIEVHEQLGSPGGQGEVYRASMSGKDYALKWYFQEALAPEQHDNLADLVRRGVPTPKFVWPLDLVLNNGVFGGYVMPIIDTKRYKTLREWTTGSVRCDFRTLCTVGYEIADSFRELHLKGLCYRDLSDGNIWFDAKTGEILVSDNDNVGVNRHSNSNMFGTPGMAAPEIYRREAKTSTDTDRYSLAVLLFSLFTLGHPLRGANEAKIRIMGPPAQKQLFGNNPVFIYDPAKDENRPVPNIHNGVIRRWPALPLILQEHFIRAFTAGLMPAGRIVESEWRNLMVQLRDLLFYCPSCGEHNFYDRKRAEAHQQTHCWNDRTVLPLPARIGIGSSVICLNKDTQLYPHHIDPHREFDFSQPVAVVVSHPGNPKMRGLKNLTQNSWTVTHVGEHPSDVPPMKVVTVKNESKLDFGTSIGSMRI